MHNLVAAQSNDVFCQAEGKDKVLYTVRPLVWTLSAVEMYYDKFRPFKIFSDEAPKNKDEFEKLIISNPALWFEIFNDETGEAVGLIFIDDLLRSRVEDRYISASYHVSMWDAKFAPRLPVHTAFVRAIFAQLKLHRLDVELPLFAGGAIRTAKKAGFVEEGVRRQAARFNGQWWGVLHLAMLESEVP